MGLRTETTGEYSLLVTSIQIRIYLVWWLIGLFLPLYAQVPSLKFITYTTNDGLLHNYTKKCIEDNKGFIWVVSETGLSRFDGVNFKNFQHDESDPSSLPHNTINDIAIDQHGWLWLALENGLCYYNPIEDCFSSIDITGTYATSPAVLSLCADQDNQAIWFMTDKALFRLNSSDFTVASTSCLNPTPSKIYSIFHSKDDQLWIACFRHGCIRYDIQHDTASSQLEGSWVMCFYEDKDQTLWVGKWNKDQFIAWNPISGNQEGWSEEDKKGVSLNMIVTGITPSPMLADSILLLSTLHMGVRIFDLHEKRFGGGFNRDIFLKSSLPTDFINYIFTDSRNILWLCTWEGFCKVNILEQQFRTIEIPFLRTANFQYYNLVEGIVAGDEPGTWWLGIDACGVIKYDTAEKKILLQLLADLTMPNVFDRKTWTEFLYKDDEGVIWALNAAGFASIIDDVATQYECPFASMHSSRKTVTVALDQSFWVTTPTHLIRFDRVTHQYEAYEIDLGKRSNFPQMVVSGSGFCDDENLWTGTFRGLYRFDVESHTGSRMDIEWEDPDSNLVNTINSLITDGHEIIYMGTPVGLGIYNIRTKQFQLKGKKENAFPILGKSLIADTAGNIWIYTTHSLFKYDPLRDEFSRFTTADGIYNFSQDPTHLFSFRNNIYIGYRGAYTEFDPLKVNVNQTMVKPVITELWAGNDLKKIDPSVYTTDYFSLPPGSKEISIHFTGIDYTNSERITFRYKLNEEDWREAGTSRFLSYTNPDPGKYTFQLQARNSSGILSDQTAVFKFFIAPTLIQQWWFWPVAALVFITIVIMLANRQIKKIRETEKLKTETNKMMAQLETKLLRSQMNPHFIFNSLNSIQKYIWENKEEDSAEYLSQFAKLIRAILENSRKEFISLKEELDVLKLYVGLEQRRSNGKFDYRIILDESLVSEDILLPPLLLQPYVENAIWHGVNKKQGHGRIEINIHQIDQQLEMVIDDDGVGRRNTLDSNGTGEKTSLGTDITQQRISHLLTQSSGTGVKIIDKEENGMPSGTRVIITIPFKYQEHA